MQTASTSTLTPATIPSTGWIQAGWAISSSSPPGFLTAPFLSGELQQISDSGRTIIDHSRPDMLARAQAEAKKEGAGNGDAQDDDIVVNGTRQQLNIILIGGPGFDSGLPRDAQILEDILKEAKKAGDTELMKRIIRQQKMLGIRNANKLRGLGRFRVGPFFMITPVIQQQIHVLNCRIGINDAMSCGA